MRKLDSNLLDEALTLLAELTQDQLPQHFVVCGGSSLLAAACWTRTQDPSDGFRDVLSNVLKSLGHESLIKQL